MRGWLTALCLLLALFAPVASAVDVPMNARQAERYHALTHQIRCVVCQNQSIASSDAGLAADLRHQVAHQVVSGQSDNQIQQYLVDRYGQWVLYDPPFQWSTWLLWGGPFALLLLGLALIYFLTRRRPRGESPEQPALDREQLAAVLAENPASKEPSQTGARHADD